MTQEQQLVEKLRRVDRVGKQAAAEDYEVFLVNDVGGRELRFGTANPLRIFLQRP